MAKNIYKLKKSDKATFDTLLEAKVMPAPTSTRPEEREFAADSGASMHMLSKKELSSEGMDTVKRSRTPYSGVDCQWRSAHPRGRTSVRSRSSSVRNRQSCRLASFAKTTDIHMSGSAVKKPQSTKDGKSFCKTDNFVPLVVPGLSINSESVWSSTSPSQNSVRRRGRNSIQETGATCFKFIFRFSIRAK